VCLDDSEGLRYGKGAHKECEDIERVREEGDGFPGGSLETEGVQNSRERTSYCVP